MRALQDARVGSIKMETKLQTSDCGIGGGGDESNGVTLSKSRAGFKDLGGEEVSIEKRLWQMSKRTRIQNAILNSKKYQPEWQRRCLVFIPRVIFYL